jgi:hypothetical protein
MYVVWTVFEMSMEGYFQERKGDGVLERLEGLRDVQPILRPALNPHLHKSYIWLRLPSFSGNRTFEYDIATRCPTPRLQDPVTAGLSDA